jgi:hypothetical protein
MEIIGLGSYMAANMIVRYYLKGKTGDKPEVIMMFYDNWQDRNLRRFGQLIPLAQRAITDIEREKHMVHPHRYSSYTYHNFNDLWDDHLHFGFSQQDKIMQYILGWGQDFKLDGKKLHVINYEELLELSAKSITEATKEDCGSIRPLQLELAL